MPGDIRSFFGGGGPPRAVGTAKNTPDKSKAPKQRGRKVVSDDDEDIEVKPKKPAPSKARKEAKEDKLQETTSSAYFATNGKSKASTSTPIRSKPQPSMNGSLTTPTKPPNGSAPSTGRKSTRKTASKNYKEDDDDEDRTNVLKVEDEGADDIYAEDFKKTGRRGGDDYEESSDDDVIMKPTVRPPKLLPAEPRSGSTRKQDTEDEDEDIVMAEIPAYDGGGDSKRKQTAKGKASGRKRKSIDSDEDDDASFLDDEDEAPKKKARKTATKSTPKPRRGSKKEERGENKEVQDIFDAIPTVRAPTPPPRDTSGKFDWRGGQNNTNTAPSAAGSKEIPVGEENCLAGLTFVFTGVLESLGREEGQSLVKRYGGRCTSGPSKKTDYVVLGDEAGPKKLETIAKLELKTINEDGLFELIRRLPANGGDGKAAEKHAEKKAAQEEKIKEAAEEMRKKEEAAAKETAKAQKAASAAVAKGSSQFIRAPPRLVDPNDKLWVDKYAPDSITAVCGNKTTVESLQRWLRNWHSNAKWNFKKAGADGKGIYRAAMLHGPPGIGKTTAAHLVAKLEGFDVVESNASDTRSKKLVETGLKGVLDTTSLLGYFAGDGKKVDAAKKKLVLIMDEVDGMSAGDRGGVGALAAVAKKTNIPMILICNERRLPKMKPFDFVTADFTFRRPTVDMIRGRIMTICFREGLKIPGQVVDQLIEGSHADIRQIINMISTVKLDNKNIDFNDSKAMAKAWEKHVILKPWDIVGKILRPQLFAASSTATLNDKIELYFNDHEFSYLMLQENYLKTVPAGAASYAGKDKEYNLKRLELAENAAASISDGDMVDRMIHGSQQQWSLMPTHAVFSFVRPASFMNGNFNEKTAFSSWLGQNSKFGKLTRFVKEIQGHMRLRASGDRHEIRQQYLPAVWQKTVAALKNEGKDVVPDVIDFMDSYYLTRDDFDSVNELGVGPMDMEMVKIDTATKAAFTRLYNSQNHPMPFIKASSVGEFSKLGGGGKKVKPDLEEAIDEDDGDMLEVEPKEEDDDELDLKKDKYVKAPKKKPAPKASAAKGKAKGKGKGKKAADEDDNDDEDDEDGVKEESEEEDVKPKKKNNSGAKGGRKGKGKV